MLTGIYAGVSPQRVRDNTGWDLLISPDLTDIAPPSDAELTALRDLRTVGTPLPRANGSEAPLASRTTVPMSEGASS